LRYRLLHFRFTERVNDLRVYVADGERRGVVGAFDSARTHWAETTDSIVQNQQRRGSTQHLPIYGEDGTTKQNMYTSKLLMRGECRQCFSQGGKMKSSSMENADFRCAAVGHIMVVLDEMNSSAKLKLLQLDKRRQMKIQGQIL
jgi:hypothetical protein